MKLNEKAQKFFNELEEHGNEGRSLAEAVAHVAADIDGLKDVGAMRDAIKQLEEKTTTENADRIKALETRVQKAERQAFNPVGQYRGAFASEDAARAFGLLVIGKTLGHDWATDALKSEHKSLYDGAVKNKVFSSTTADSVIPEVWSNTIENLLEDHGVFERDALTVPMPAPVVNWSKKTGRVSAVPMSEGAAIAAMEASLIPLELSARKWGAYSEINNEVTEDSIIAIAEFVATDMAEAHALAVDEAGFLGDGTAAFNQITGVVNALGSAAIKTAGAADWSGYTLPQFTEGTGRLATKAYGGIGMPKWYGSHAYYWTVLAPLQLAAGGNMVADIGRGPVLQFLGFEVEFTEVLPSTAAAAQIPLVFGNLRRGAAFGNRRQLSFKTSDQFRFANDQTAMLSTRRFDINVHGAGDAQKAETLVGFRTAG